MNHPIRTFRTIAALAAALVVATFTATGARAGDAITVGKAVPNAWTFTPIDIGVEKGILKKHGFDEVKIVSFGGDAKLQQALLSKDIDFGLASGPGMAFNAKGGGGYGVAAFYGAPRNLGIAIPYDSTMSQLAELKGKKLSVSTAGSLTYWLAQRLSQQMGWGVDGVTPVPLGGFQHSLAALQTKQVDAMVTATETALLLERQKKIKQLYNFAELVPRFITHVIEARKDIVKDKPDVVRRFVAAWFDTIDYVRAHKAESVEIAARVLRTPADIVERIYDLEIGEYSKTGAFDPEAVAILKQSFIEMTVLDRKPTDEELFTEAFLPKREVLTR